VLMLGEQFFRDGLDFGRAQHVSFPVLQGAPPCYPGLA
jgi:hypothetical protein